MRLSQSQFVTGIFRVLRNTLLMVFSGAQAFIFESCECHTEEKIAIKYCVCKHVSIIFRPAKYYLIYRLSFNSLQGSPTIPCRKTLSSRICSVQQILEEVLSEVRQMKQIMFCSSWQPVDHRMTRHCSQSQSFVAVAKTNHCRYRQIRLRQNIHQHPFQSFVWLSSTTHPTIILIWFLVNHTE